ELPMLPVYTRAGFVGSMAIVSKLVRALLNPVVCAVQLLPPSILLKIVANEKELPSNAAEELGVAYRFKGFVGSIARARMDGFAVELPSLRGRSNPALTALQLMPPFVVR